MSTTPPDGDGYRGIAGHEGPRSGRRGAHSLVRADVQGEGPVDAVQRSLVDHQAGTGEPLLARLEHEADPTGDLSSSGG